MDEMPGGPAFERQVADAAQRGREQAVREPRASAARYASEEGVFHVRLRNGCGFSFPPAAVPGLEGAPAEALADVEVDPGGEGLHWETLDVDVSLPGLLFRSLGIEHWAAKFLAGKTSAAKAAAARENGKKGGRPPKRRPGPVPYAPPRSGLMVVRDAGEDAGAEGGADEAALRPEPEPGPGGFRYPEGPHGEEKKRGGRRRRPKGRGEPEG
jgi:hypothetical protein